MSKNKLILAGVIAGIVSIVLALIAFYVLNYIMPANSANNALSSIFHKKGNIVSVSTQLSTFKGQNLKGATVNQKALVATGYPESEKSAMFIFDSDAQSNNKKKIVDLYISFGAQTSRDFMLINQANFASILRSGQAIIKVHPVPGGSSYDLYAAQCVADALQEQPEVAWKLIFALLRAGANASDLSSNKEVQDLVLKTAKDMGFTKMRVESLQEGRFSSWILAVGDDKALQNSFMPPVLMVDDKKIDPTRTNYNNPNEVLKGILK